MVQCVCLVFVLLIFKVDFQCLWGQGSVEQFHMISPYLCV